MSTILNKVLNFVGWETEDEEEDVETVDESLEIEEDLKRPQFQPISRRTQNKVVNIHSASQFKVIVMQPESFNDAKDVCDHLKSKSR
ncbi:FtsZ-interacting protein [Acetivibrio straminisolvens JCM 21531]|uniref:FtsZ-interacting protein n=1 Tax=Acetivibrio straminisolvens JCM 21531 TaxID=1294263 RepID=W4V3D0_9FIRM|nr:cell division protein SepF [Acetivibrio straminisolvens]GAE87716.1 FtsZ-interacting protein [Acetivibrio straminisolvens JCM 21531]